MMAAENGCSVVLPASTSQGKGSNNIAVRPSTAGYREGGPASRMAWEQDRMARQTAARHAMTPQGKGRRGRSLTVCRLDLAAAAAAAAVAAFVCQDEKKRQPTRRANRTDRRANRTDRRASRTNRRANRTDRRANRTIGRANQTDARKVTQQQARQLG